MLGITAITAVAGGVKKLKKASLSYLKGQEAYGFFTKRLDLLMGLLCGGAVGLGQKALEYFYKGRDIALGGH